MAILRESLMSTNIACAGSQELDVAFFYTCMYTVLEQREC